MICIGDTIINTAYLTAIVLNGGFAADGYTLYKYIAYFVDSSPVEFEFPVATGTDPIQAVYAHINGN